MIRSVTIGATINIANYESMRIEVTADTAEEAKAEVVRIARESAGNSATLDLIEKYVQRIGGGSL